MYIGNPEIHKIGSGMKLFITFLSLRFFDMRRKRHNFFNKRAAHFVDPNWSHRGLNLNSSVRSLNLNSPNQCMAPVAHKAVWPCPGLNLN